MVARHRRFRFPGHSRDTTPMDREPGPPHGREPMPRVPYRNLTQSDEMAEKLDMSTAEIGLSVRTTNCLE